MTKSRPKEDLEKFESVENFTRQAWARTKSFWITLLVAWLIIMMVSYL